MILQSDKPNIPLTRYHLGRLFSKMRISDRHSYKGDPCWEWTASCNKRTGYAQIGHTFDFGVFNYITHRVVYEWFVGDIPRGLVIDHLCRIKHCVNPAHLEVVTSATNTARIVWTGKPGGPEQTHCNAGHPFSGDNLKWEKNYMNNGTRGGSAMRKVCRACRNERSRINSKKQRDRRRENQCLI
jgi:hypothetical protein